MCPFSPPQAADKALVEQQADLIAFDRVNHMGISQQTAESIKTAIASEAAQSSAPGGASSVINIKENEDRVKQLKVSRQSASCNIRLCNILRFLHAFFS